MHQNTNQNNEKHIPVLLDEVLTVLEPKEGDKYLDLTAGYGGHASEILESIATYKESVLVDRDVNAITELTKKFGASGVRLLHENFYEAAKALKENGEKFDIILADLGVSSPHLNEVSRGFSIAKSGPLDMRMDQRQDLTAEVLVNSYSEAQLENILRKYGEEPKAKRIARAIVQSRPLKTTDELSQIAAKAWPGRSRVHPATRTFQAIRVAVNDELGLVERTLPIAMSLLNPGGRLAVISFHSLEDRLVKQAFAAVSGENFDDEFRLITKHPIIATSNETVFNPRARSAKLRAVVKK